MEKPKLFRGYHYPMDTYIGNQKAGGFTQLSLDLTSRCNYRCDWCFNLNLLGKDPKDLLTFDEKKQLLEQSVELGAKTLVFPGTGEPMIDRDFFPLIRFAHQLGITTVVYSNLTGNLNSQGISDLCANDVSIGIKFDSLKPEHFVRRYHTTPQMYDIFIENLHEISRVYGDSKESLPQGEVYRGILNTVLTHENKDELPELSKKSEELGFPIFVRPVKPVTWAKANPDAWKKLGNSNSTSSPDPELIDLARRHNTLFSPSCTLENHCAIYSFGLTVKNNGDLQICPDHNDSRGSFGNIRTISIKEVMRRLNQQRVIQPGYCVMLPSVQH